MSVYFKEIIFPRKEKVKIIPPSSKERITGMNEAKARALFETVYCGKKGGWFSMVECIGCVQATKKLEEILETDIGCED